MCSVEKVFLEILQNSQENTFARFSFKKAAGLRPATLLNSDSHLPKKFLLICFNKSPLKIIKNAFYFIIKALFVLKIFKFLS